MYLLSEVVLPSCHSTACDVATSNMTMSCASCRAPAVPSRCMNSGSSLRCAKMASTSCVRL